MRATHLLSEQELNEIGLGDIAGKLGRGTARLARGAAVGTGAAIGGLKGAWDAAKQGYQVGQAAVGQGVMPPKGSLFPKTPSQPDTTTTQTPTQAPAQAPAASNRKDDISREMARLKRELDAIEQSERQAQQAAAAAPSAAPTTTSTPAAPTTSSTPSAAPTTTSTPAAPPKPRPQGGGRQPGGLSQTPGAQAKRASRAAAKPAATPPATPNLRTVAGGKRSKPAGTTPKAPPAAPAAPTAESMDRLYELIRKIR